MNRSYLKLLFLLILIFTGSANSSIFAKNKNNNLLIEVKIINDATIYKKLISLSKELEQIAQIYKTGSQVTYWENEGLKSFRNLLESEGYYDADLSSEIPTQVNNNNKIIFSIELNNRYKISDINIKHLDNSNKNIILPNIEDLHIKKNDSAIAQDIIDTQAKILTEIEDKNCLLNMSISHEAIINHLSKSVAIIYMINAGKEANIGLLKLEGLKNLNPEYVKKLVSIKRSQCFKQTTIKQVELDLQKSGLFAGVTHEISENPNTQKEVDILFNLTERRPRSLKAGISYGTDKSGIGLKGSWENRNFGANGEKIRADVSVYRKEQFIDLKYIKPFYLRDDQNLILGAKFETAKTKAYKSKEGSISAGVERKFSKTWQGQIRGKYSLINVKENLINGVNEKNFSIISSPIIITRDTRSNFLDSRDGHKIELSSFPSLSLKKKNSFFLKNKALITSYLTFDIPHEPVIATRLVTGIITGAKSSKLPATEKFYIGGMDSVRGYRNQMGGMLNPNNIPIGGRSMIEGSVELRLRVKGDLGVVLFSDFGRNYTNSNYSNNKNIITGAKNAKKFIYGAGLGVRYYTAFGPFRAEISVPVGPGTKINKRNYQTHFGIGQNF